MSEKKKRKEKYEEKVKIKGNLDDVLKVAAKPKKKK